MQNNEHGKKKNKHSHTEHKRTHTQHRQRTQHTQHSNTKHKQTTQKQTTQKQQTPTLTHQSTSTQCSDIAEKKQQIVKLLKQFLSLIHI